MQPIPQEADAVVIGAGISGCATAYNLAKRGLKVVVLEKDDIAFEASGRTFAAVGLMGKHHPDEFALAMASMELWRNLAEELGTDFEMVHGGRLAIAHEPKDIPLFREMIKGAEESGVPIEWYEPAEARKRWPFLEGPFIQAANSPSDTHVNPNKVVNALAAAAKEAGAEFPTSCLVQNINVAAGQVVSVSTNQGEMKANVVVNAAGVWAPRLLDKVGVHIPIKPVRMVLGETGPVPRFFDTFIRGPSYGARQTGSDAIRVTAGYRKYDTLHELSIQDLKDLRIWLPRLIQQRSNISLDIDWRVTKREVGGLLARLVGRNGSVAPTGFEPKKNPRMPAQRLARLIKLVPRLQGARIERSWGAYIDLTPDLLPVFGALERPKGLYVALGFSGHGFAIGPIVGKLLSDLIIEGKTPLHVHAFRPSRFKEEKVKMPRRLV